MKIIHTSDWHLGHLIEGKYSQEDEQKAMLAQMAQMVRDHEPDAFVISGDVYDTTVPSATTQKMLTDALLEIHAAKPDMQIFCIAGNHDSGARHMIFSNAWKSMNVHMVGNIHSDSDLEEYIFKVEGVAWFATIPFSADRFMPERVYERISEMIAARNTDEQLPVVLMAHVAVGNCDSIGHDLADEDQVGGLRRIPLADFGDGYDYVALGHIHKQQRLDDEGKVWYSGTPLAVSFDESFPGNDHGALLVECDGHGKEVHVTHLHVDNPKPLVNIPTTGLGEWDDVIEEFRRYPSDIQAYIRLNVEVRDYLTSGANAMAVSVGDTKACTFCKINAQRKSDAAKAQEHHGLTTSELKKKDPVEIAQIWFRDVKGWKGFDEKVKAVVDTAKKSLEEHE